MWVSLLAWVLRAYTEQEESQDDSSRCSLLAACQLEANRHRQAPFLIAEAARAQFKCTVKRGKEMDSSPRASHVIHRRNSRFHQHLGKYIFKWRKYIFKWIYKQIYIQVKEREGKHPVLVQFLQIIHRLSLHRRLRGTTQIVSSLYNNSQNPGSLFYKLGSKLYEDIMTSHLPPNSIFF